MTTLSFWKGLVGIVVIAVMVLWALHELMPQTDAFGVFNFVTIAVFTGIVTGAFYLGNMAAASESKVRFIQLVMMIIFVKMMVCVLLIAVYIKVNSPSSRYFVIPFLAIYLIFTIFEVIVLERIARSGVPVK